MLIAEDGTGLTNSESYCSLSFADAYFIARGVIQWDELDTTDDKEIALRRATDYLEGFYGLRWRGVRYKIGQALAWPRSYVEQPQNFGEFAYFSGTYQTYFPAPFLPLALQNACAELALRATTAELAPDLSRLEKRVTVGPITTEYVAGSEVTRYRSIENTLSPYLQAGAGSSLRLVRA